MALRTHCKNPTTLAEATPSHLEDTHFVHHHHLSTRSQKVSGCCAGAPPRLDFVKHAEAARIDTVFPSGHAHSATRRLPGSTAALPPTRTRRLTNESRACCARALHWRAFPQCRRLRTYDDGCDEVERDGENDHGPAGGLLDLWRRSRVGVLHLDRVLVRYSLVLRHGGSGWVVVDGNGERKAEIVGGLVGMGWNREG